METAIKFERGTAGQRWRLRHLLTVAAASTTGIAYCLAAQEDEKNGFPLTAAMEWRKAAELFTPISLLSDRCWHHWERLMHLPRRLAEPITDCNEVVLQFSRVSKQATIPNHLINTFSIAAAA